MASLPPNTPLRPLPRLIFASRWLQMPLYLGLIAAQGVYVYHFWVELLHLLEAASGNQAALQQLITAIGYRSDYQITALNETLIMLVVLALIDVVMISNLLIMVIVGGGNGFGLLQFEQRLPDHASAHHQQQHTQCQRSRVFKTLVAIGVVLISVFAAFAGSGQHHKIRHQV